MVDSGRSSKLPCSFKADVQKIPLLTVKAGPRDGADWVERLKEELAALIKYVQINKASQLVLLDGGWRLGWRLGLRLGLSGMNDECLVIIIMTIVILL